MNRDPSKAWPDEPSLLVLGATVDQARWLARRFHQLAFVSINANGLACLNFVQQTLPSRENTEPSLHAITSEPSMW